MKSAFILGLSAAMALMAGAAFAEPVSVEVLLEPKEQVKFDFSDGSKHFVLAVRREGVAKGTGMFDGTTVTEIGWHDVNPPVSGEPQGYLQITAENGDIAVLRWSAKATFLKGQDGKPSLVNHGVWELASGTGQFENRRGVGSLLIQPQGGPNLFILEGDVGEKA